MIPSVTSSILLKDRPLPLDDRLLKKTYFYDRHNMD